MVVFTVITTSYGGRGVVVIPYKNLDDAMKAVREELRVAKGMGAVIESDSDDFFSVFNSEGDEILYDIRIEELVIITGE